MTTEAISPPAQAPRVTRGAIRSRPNVRRVIQLACIWSGVPMVLMLMIGLLAAGFIPPLKPSASMASIAHTYRTDTNSIRLWLAFSFLSIILLFPFGMAIAAQTRRIEGSTPVLTYIQIASLGSDAVALEPQSLRDDVIERLREHAGVARSGADRE